MTHMDQIQLRPVSYADLSGLRHETLVSEGPWSAHRAFLVIRYTGAYRHGSGGRGDALYIVAAAAAAREAWRAECAILDFQDLEYVWGDEMDWILGVGWDRVTRCHAP